MEITLTELKGTSGEMVLTLKEDHYIITDNRGSEIVSQLQTVNNHHTVLKSGFVSYFVNTKQHKSLNTVYNYYNGIKLFIDYLKSIGITSIDSSNLADLLSDYNIYLETVKGLAPSTRNSYQIYLYEFFKTNKIMKALGLKEPIAPIKNETEKKNGSQKRERSFSYSTYKQILRTIPADDYKTIAIIKTLAKSGLRVNEFTGLNKEDICSVADADNPENNKPLSLDKNGLFIKPLDDIIYIYVKDGKGGKTRAVEVSSDLIDTLNNMINKRITKKIKQLSNPEDPNSNIVIYSKVFPRYKKKELADPSLFKNKSFKRISDRSIQNLTKSLGLQTLERLENINAPDIDYTTLNHLHPHLFRKFNASMLLNSANLSLEYVRDRLGHESVQTTQIYIKSDAETKKRAYKKALEVLDKEYD